MNLSVTNLSDLWDRDLDEANGAWKALVKFTIVISKYKYMGASATDFDFAIW